MRDQLKDQMFLHFGKTNSSDNLYSINPFLMVSFKSFLGLKQPILAIL